MSIFEVVCKKSHVFQDSVKLTIKVYIVLSAGPIGT